MTSRKTYLTPTVTKPIDLPPPPAKSPWFSGQAAEAPVEFAQEVMCDPPGANPWREYAEEYRNRCDLYDQPLCDSRGRPLSNRFGALVNRHAKGVIGQLANNAFRNGLAPTPEAAEVMVREAIRAFPADRREATESPPAPAQPSVANEAARYANRLGIYAVPCGGDNRHWRPRTPSGRDPDLEWLLDAEPDMRGWPSWESAVVALGRHMESSRDCQRRNS